VVTFRLLRRIFRIAENADAHPEAGIPFGKTQAAGRHRQPQA